MDPAALLGRIVALRGALGGVVGLVAFLVIRSIVGLVAPGVVGLAVLGAVGLAALGVVGLVVLGGGSGGAVGLLGGLSGFADPFADQAGGFGSLLGGDLVATGDADDSGIDAVVQLRHLDVDGALAGFRGVILQPVADEAGDGVALLLGAVAAGPGRFDLNGVAVREDDDHVLHRGLVLRVFREGTVLVHNIHFLDFHGFLSPSIFARLCALRMLSPER